MMKNIFPILSLVIVFAVGCTTQAQRPGGERFVLLVQAAMDVNSDGVISADEMAQAPAALRKLDKNDDGKLTEEEVRPNFDRERRERPGNDGNEEVVNSLMAFDENKDGKLSKQELPERMQGIFARADADHDGFLTRDELTKMAAAQSAAGSNEQGPGQGKRDDHGERGADRGGRGGGGPGGPGAMMRVMPLLAALDANSDGVIIADEISNAPATLKTLDKNGDGQLTEDEFRPAFGPGRRGRPNGERPPSNYRF